MKETRFNFSVK